MFSKTIAVLTVALSSVALFGQQPPATQSSPQLAESGRPQDQWRDGLNEIVLPLKPALLTLKPW